MERQSLRVRSLRLSIAVVCALAANAQAQFGKTDPDIAFPRLDVTTVALTPQTQTGQRVVQALESGESLIPMADTVRVWLNDALLERAKDYDVTTDAGLRIELTAKRAPKRMDELRVSVDARRRNLTDDKPFAMADLRGHVVVVDVWATWCGPCVREIPDFVAYQKANAERKFSYIGVSVDSPDDIKDVRDFVAKHKVNYPIVLGDRAFVESLAPVLGRRLEGIPTKIVLNRQGKVAFWLVGSPKGSPQEAEFLKRLDSLLLEPIPDENEPTSAS